MTLAHDFFCGVGQCWIGDLIDGVWQFGSVLLEYAIPLMQIFALMYMMYWIGLIIRVVKEGDVAPIVDHVMKIWHLLSSVANMFVNMIQAVIPF